MNADLEQRIARLEKDYQELLRRYEDQRLRIERLLLQAASQRGVKAPTT